MINDALKVFPCRVYVVIRKMKIHMLDGSKLGILEPQS